MIKNGKRELAYIQKISWVRQIEGADNIELIGIAGWTCIAKKGEFTVGDLCVYFEIDSKLPKEKWSEFMESKHYKVKTMKLNKFGVISQGLALPLYAFEGYFNLNVDGWLYMKNGNPAKGKRTEDYLVQVGDPLTEFLNVTYAVESDNKRKARNNKYTGMIQRHQKLFKTNKIVKWLYKRKWGKELLFLFLGKKKDGKYGFPKHFPYIHVTDEERVENLVPMILEDKEEWIRTLKIDGTSATYILERKPFHKAEFYVCSRNVRQLSEDQECYHDENVYWNMEKKYHIQDVLQSFLDSDPTIDYICIQGEIAGVGVQGNPHKLNETNFYAFNLIDSEQGRYDSISARQILFDKNIPFVPILQTDYVLPDTIEELKEQADGECELEGSSGLREGYVYRSKDGQRSFKNVSNKFLIKKGQ